MIVTIILMENSSVDNNVFISTLSSNCPRPQAVYGAGPLPAPHWNPWEGLPPSEPPEWDSDCKCFLGVSPEERKPLHWPGGREGLIPLCLLHCEYGHLT